MENTGRRGTVRKAIDAPHLTKIGHGCAAPAHTWPTSCKAYKSRATPSCWHAPHRRTVHLHNLSYHVAAENELVFQLLIIFNKSIRHFYTFQPRNNSLVIFKKWRSKSNTNKLMIHPFNKTLSITYCLIIFWHHICNYATHAVTKPRQFALCLKLQQCTAWTDVAHYAHMLAHIVKSYRNNKRTHKFNAVSMPAFMDAACTQFSHKWQYSLEHASLRMAKTGQIFSKTRWTDSKNTNQNASYERNSNHSLYQNIITIA